MFVHWLDCPTGPGCVHFCSCTCGDIVLSHSGTRHLSESVAACAGCMRPGGRERKGLSNQCGMTGYAVGWYQSGLNVVSHKSEKDSIFCYNINKKINSYAVTSVCLEAVFQQC